VLVELRAEAEQLRAAGLVEVFGPTEVTDYPTQLAVRRQRGGLAEGGLTEASTLL
jgi:hypothetical protein